MQRVVEKNENDISKTWIISNGVNICLLKYIFLNFTSHFDFELNYLIHYLIIWLLSYSFIQLLFSSTFSNSIFNEIKPKLNHVYLLQISPPNRFAYVKLSALKPAACYISDCLNENIYPVSSEQVFNISK